MSVSIAMEQIVRPFAPVNVRPPNVIGFNRGLPAGVIPVKLGGNGGTSISFTLNGKAEAVKEDNKFHESGRESTKRRVENESDPEQAVEFCQADKITLTPANKDRQKPRTSSYDTSGGYHNNANASPTKVGSTNREYNFKYPTSKNCASPSKPARGC